MLKWIWLFSFLFDLIFCSGKCGPTYYSPENASDCIPYSIEGAACCMLSMRDAPAEFKICYLMNLTDVSPIISIGRLSYEVDCQGMENYSKIFPLEGLYDSCGVQNPLSPGDCWPYTTGLGACCMTGENEIMNGDGDPFCYFFPEAKFEKKNFTVKTKHPDGIKYYVSCQGYYNKFTFIFTIILFLFLL